MNVSCAQSLGLRKHLCFSPCLVEVAGRSAGTLWVSGQKRGSAGQPVSWSRTPRMSPYHPTMSQSQVILDGLPFLQASASPSSAASTAGRSGKPQSSECILELSESLHLSGQNHSCQLDSELSPGPADSDMATSPESRSHSI